VPSPTGTRARRAKRPHKLLGERIRAAREATGISQERFAPLVGTTRRNLIRIEGGRTRPHDELLARIAAATKRSVEALLGKA
jgi:transcriptional regulator with XRE-family HTH domain